MSSCVRSIPNPCRNGPIRARAGRCSSSFDFSPVRTPWSSHIRCWLPPGLLFWRFGRCWRCAAFMSLATSGTVGCSPRRWPNHWRVPATGRTPEVFFAHEGTFDRQANWYLNTIYRRDLERGYAGLEDAWSPGAAHVRLAPGQSTYFACSAEPMELAAVIARYGQIGKLEQPAVCGGSAVQQDVETIHSAPGDPWLDCLTQSAGAVRAPASPRGGLGLRDPAGGAGIPGRHRSLPLGHPSIRSAMVGFVGLMLVPRRFADARSLLLWAASQIQDGLIPSELPEDGSPPAYLGDDVSLWFVHAVWQYLRYTGDDLTVARDLMPTVWEILHAYRRGTGLGIGCDPDGLLHSGATGVGCTWMSARIGDWLVTPRHGRAVEIRRALAQRTLLRRRLVVSTCRGQLPNPGRRT